MRSCNQEPGRESGIPEIEPTLCKNWGVLPAVDSPANFDRLLFRPEQWTDAIAAVARRHHLRGPFVQSTRGSSVVFLSERTCIKLQPPLPGYLASHEREVAALGFVASKLPIDTPEIRAEGELETWRYFVSTRLPGRPIDEVWDGLEPPHRIRVAQALGEAIRSMHALGGGPLVPISEPWSTFRATQRARCLELERRKGLPRERQAELEAYLSRLEATSDPRRPATLLHTEIGPSHVLVDQERITGVIDFGDAMAGHPEYDLAPVGMFVTRGDAGAFRAFSEAYGLDAEALSDPDRPARLMRHGLLHRYGTLAWYLDTLGPPPGSLDDLANHWFGVG